MNGAFEVPSRSLNVHENLSLPAAAVCLAWTSPFARPGQGSSKTRLVLRRSSWRMTYCELLRSGSGVVLQAASTSAFVAPTIDPSKTV
jgi:hypothetical protein